MQFLEVGQTYTIAGRLWYGSLVQAAPNLANQAGFVDASNTALLSINVLTEGVSYTSASGTIYSVPEPSSWMGLLGFIGIMGGALVRRRSSSKAV